MKVHIELDENDLKQLVLSHLKKELGDMTLKYEDLHIEVKSTQNYKSEWEIAAFRAVVDKSP